MFESKSVGVGALSFAHPGRVSGSADGFAAVDAMVALLILSVTMVTALQALQQAERVTARAEEFGRADRLIRQLMRAPTSGYAPLSGRTPGFDWSVAIRPLGANLPVAVCRRDVRLVSRASQRPYAAATDEVCPLDAPNA